jgi:hypothetical protein
VTRLGFLMIVIRGQWEPYREDLACAGVGVDRHCMSGVACPELEVSRLRLR